MSETQDFKQRLETLETAQVHLVRQVRIGKIIGLICVGLIGAALVSGQAQQKKTTADTGTYDSLEARALVIRSYDNKVVARLGASNGGGALWLSDDNEKNRITLGMNRDSSALTLYDFQGGEVLNLVAAVGGSGLRMSSPGRKYVGCEINVNSDSSRLRILDSNGREAWLTPLVR